MTESPPQPDRTDPVPEPASGSEHSETAGLVLVINIVLEGLGTLYATTNSLALTLASAALVLLIVVMKRRNERDARLGRRGDRSGQ